MTTDSLSIIVDYNRSIEDMVESGKYDQADACISSKNFPANNSGIIEVNIELYQFEKIMSSYQMVWAIKRDDLRAANIRELLALGEKYPELQRDFPIVALGSECEGRQIPMLVYYGVKYMRSLQNPVIHGNKSERRLSLDLNVYNERWGGIYHRFACVKK